MKTNKFLIFYFFLFIIIFVNSCTKENNQLSIEDNLADQSLETRSKLPTTINKMLHFESFDDFDNLIQKLKDENSDIENLKRSYIELGVDITSEFLPNLTDYPGALLFERKIKGFSSARKTEEKKINDALNRGDDKVFSIISDPFLKSVLNENYSVHIGTRIFKFYSNGGVAIVLNNDWPKYNSIKSLEYGKIRQGGNLIVTNDSRESWKAIYETDKEGKILKEKKVDKSANFESNVNVSNSLLICTIGPNQILVTPLSSGQARFELLSSPDPNLNNWDTYVWTFSNGTQFSGNPIIIPCNGSGQVSLSVYRNDGYSCSGSTSYICGGACGIKKSKDAMEDFPNAGGSGKRIRIDARIWVTDNEIGCNSKHFGRNILQMWVPLNLIFNTTGVFANIQGSFQRQVSIGNCNIINQPFNEKQLPVGSFNGSMSNIISQPGINFMNTGQLSSGHRLRLQTGGTFFGFGVDRPRLILD